MKNNGMESQKEYYDYLKQIMSRDIQFTVGEFIDTRRARSFVAANPSDLYACYKSTPWLIEVKSVIDRSRFPLKNVKGTQFGIGRRYVLSGWKYMFVIHHIAWGFWYFVPFDFLYSKFKDGKSSVKWEELQPFKKHKEYEFWELH